MTNICSNRSRRATLRRLGYTEKQVFASYTIEASSEEEASAELKELLRSEADYFDWIYQDDTPNEINFDIIDVDDIEA